MKSIKNILYLIVFLIGLQAYPLTVFEVAQTTQSLLEKKKKGQKLSSTELVLLSYCLKKNKTKNSFENLVDRISIIETSMEKRGYTTFVHARNWGWNFVNDLWNLIQALENKSSSLDQQKVWMRHRDKTCSSAELYNMRKKLIENGAKEYCRTGVSDADLVFMNLTLVSNLAYPGESTGWFYFNQFSEGKAQEYMYSLIEKYNLQPYEKELYALYDEHAALSNYGEMVCISVNDKYLNELIYVAKEGGFRYTGKTYPHKVSENIAFVKKYAQDIAHLEDKNKDDYCVYCFACIDIPSERAGRYSVQSVHMADESRHQEYKKKLHALFKKIKQDRLVKK